MSGPLHASDCDVSSDEECSGEVGCPSNDKIPRDEMQLAYVLQNAATPVESKLERRIRRGRENRHPLTLKLLRALAERRAKENDAARP